MGADGFTCFSGLPPTFGATVCAKADTEKPMIAATISRVLIVISPLPSALPSPFSFSVPQFANGDEEWHIHSLEWSGFVGMVVGHFPFAFSLARWWHVHYGLTP
jgi:hypothetical protein